MPFPLIGEVQAAGLTPTELDLGDLYSKMGMPDQAKAQYQTVLARQPAHEAAARGLASLRNPG